MSQPTVTLFQGDCLEFMKTLAPGVVDAVTITNKTTKPAMMVIPSQVIIALPIVCRLQALVVMASFNLKREKSATTTTT